MKAPAGLEELIPALSKSKRFGEGAHLDSPYPSGGAGERHVCLQHPVNCIRTGMAGRVTTAASCMRGGGRYILIKDKLLGYYYAQAKRGDTCLAIMSNGCDLSIQNCI